MKSPPPVSFETQIIPIFSKAGCNSGGCHGKAEGKNGFKLSVFGFDPLADHQALVMEARGRRLFPAAPDSSLLLLKASGPAAARRRPPPRPEFLALSAPAPLDRRGRPVRRWPRRRHRHRGGAAAAIPRPGRHATIARDRPPGRWQAPRRHPGGPVRFQCSLHRHRGRPRLDSGEQYPGRGRHPRPLPGARDRVPRHHPSTGREVRRGRRRPTSSTASPGTTWPGSAFLPATWPTMPRSSAGPSSTRLARCRRWQKRGPSWPMRGPTSAPG